MVLHSRETSHKKDINKVDNRMKKEIFETKEVPVLMPPGAGVAIIPGATPRVFLPGVNGEAVEFLGGGAETTGTLTLSSLFSGSTLTYYKKGEWVLLEGVLTATGGGSNVIVSTTPAPAAIRPTASRYPAATFFDDSASAILADLLIIAPNGVINHSKGVAADDIVYISCVYRI